MAALAAGRGRAVAVLSVDDAYLDHDQRARLAREVHPLLATRGPPGTHDVALACRTLDALRAGQTIALPRFNKLADRRLPETDRTSIVEGKRVSGRLYHGGRRSINKNKNK